MEDTTTDNEPAVVLARVAGYVLPPGREATHDFDESHAYGWNPTDIVVAISLSPQPDRKEVGEFAITDSAAMYSYPLAFRRFKVKNIGTSEAGYDLNVACISPFSNHSLVGGEEIMQEDAVSGTQPVVTMFREDGHVLPPGAQATHTFDVSLGSPVYVISVVPQNISEKIRRDGGEFSITQSAKVAGGIAPSHMRFTVTNIGKSEAGYDLAVARIAYPLIPKDS